MNEIEKLTVGALVSALALVVPGFVLHVSQRFPGSLTGSLFGIAAALLFIVLLTYSLAKRSPWSKERITRHASLRAILLFHVYAGVVGALLAIVHTGHKFGSPLGLGLVVAMLIVVFSGFAGHYYLAQIGTDLRDQQSMLAVLRPRYDAVAAALAGAPAPTAAVLQNVSLPQLLAAIAELEYAVSERETLKRTLSRWVFVHIGAAIVMYSLLVLHIWNGIYYGLRWLG